MLQSITSNDPPAGLEEYAPRPPLQRALAPFGAKSAAPCSTRRWFHHGALDQAAAGMITLFNAPAGYLLADSLAATLAERGRPTLWLRLGPEDHDSATFLVSLIVGAQRLRPGIGAMTLEQMRRRPGPTAGWPALFAHLASELAGRGAMERAEPLYFEVGDADR